MRRQLGIADGWLLLAGLLLAAGLLTTALVAGTSYLKGVENKGYLRGKAEVQLKMDKFVADTKAVGLKAEAAKAAQEAKNKVETEKKNAEAVVLRNALALERKRVRELRASAGGSVLPKPGPSAGGVETVTFDRAKLDAALREFLDEIEEFIGAGAAAVIELDSLKP